MNSNFIYSTGHGNKSIDQLIEELKSFSIIYLVDVRSKPYSSRNPQFNKKPLSEAVEARGITYLFLGDKLGGIPGDPSCYVDGRVDYNRLRKKDFFREGLLRLIRAHHNKVKLALMCSESNPSVCHRTKLIGQELLKKGVSVQHIVSKDRAKSQESLVNELTKGKGTTDLFGNKISFSARKPFD